MAYSIKANTFMEKCYLTVDASGVLYCKTAGFGGKRQFTFGQIDCVLLSRQGVLSLQVGNEVFSIRVRREDPNEWQAVQYLVQSAAGARW